MYTEFGEDVLYKLTLYITLHYGPRPRQALMPGLATQLHYGPRPRQAIMPGLATQLHIRLASSSNVTSEPGTLAYGSLCANMTSSIKL